MPRLSTYFLQFGGIILNIREFNSGDCFDAYKWLGAHYNGFGTMFRVYAPNADGVSVIGDFNGWEDWYLNRTGDGKFWEIGRAHV